MSSLTLFLLCACALCTGCAAVFLSRRCLRATWRLAGTGVASRGTPASQFSVTWVPSRPTWLLFPLCAREYTPMYTHKCVHKCICIHMYVYVYVYVHAFIYVCVRIAVVGFTRSLFFFLPLSLFLANTESGVCVCAREDGLPALSPPSFPPLAPLTPFFISSSCRSTRSPRRLYPTSRRR